MYSTVHNRGIQVQFPFKKTSAGETLPTKKHLSLSLSFERRERQNRRDQRKGRRGQSCVWWYPPAVASDRDYHGRSVGAAHRFGITMDVALEQHTALGLPWT